MNATSVLIACLLSFIGGAAFMAVALWFRDQTADAERWGEHLGGNGADPTAPFLDHGRDSWRGLEDVRVRVRPLYDFDKEKNG